MTCSIPLLAVAVAIGCYGITVPNAPQYTLLGLVLACVAVALTRSRKEEA